MELQHDPKQDLNELIGLLTKDPRVKVIYAEQSRGRIIIHTVVSGLETIAERPPIDHRMLQETLFDIGYLGSNPIDPPKGSEKIYERK